MLVLLSRNIDLGRMAFVTRVALVALCMAGAVRATWRSEWSGWASTAGTLTIVVVLVALAVGIIRGSEIAAKVSAAIGGVVLLMLLPHTLGLYSAFDVPGSGRLGPALNGVVGVWVFSALSFVNYAFVAMRSGQRRGP